MHRHKCVGNGAAPCHVGARVPGSTAACSASRLSIGKTRAAKSTGSWDSQSLNRLRRRLSGSSRTPNSSSSSTMTDSQRSSSASRNATMPGCGVCFDNSETTSWYPGDNHSCVHFIDKRDLASSVVATGDFKVRSTRRVFNQPSAKRCARRLTLSPHLGRHYNEGFPRTDALGTLCFRKPENFR